MGRLFEEDLVVPKARIEDNMSFYGFKEPKSHGMDYVDGPRDIAGLTAFLSTVVKMSIWGPYPPCYKDV